MQNTVFRFNVKKKKKKKMIEIVWIMKKCVFHTRWSEAHKYGHQLQQTTLYPTENNIYILLLGSPLCSTSGL